MNIRFLLAIKPQSEPSWWFGGGMDMTPLLRVRRDARHFHSVCRQALDAFGSISIPASKARATSTSISAPRRTTKASEGFFFDDLNDGGFDRCFGLARSVGDHFLPAYVPVLERRRSLPTASASVTSRPIAAAAMWSSISSMIAARCSACSRPAAPSRY